MLRILGTALGIAVLAASTAEAASFGCASSAGRLTSLGQTVEPVRAVAGATACGTETQSLTGSAGLPAGVSAAALAATTQVFSAEQSVLASGGVADLRVLSLPNLPLTLPTVSVPDAARTAIGNALKVNVDLTGVKAAIPVLPTDLVTNLVTDLATTFPAVIDKVKEDMPVSFATPLVGDVINLPLLPTTLPENLPESIPAFSINAADPALDTAAEVSAANALVDAAEDANSVANDANVEANQRNIAANSVTNQLNVFATIDALEIAPFLTAVATTDAVAVYGTANQKNILANDANTAAKAANAALKSLYDSINASHVVTNAANTATNAANTATNLVRSSIPNSVAFDGSSSLDALLAGLLPDGKLPTRELFRVQSAGAYASGSCKSGAATVAGSSAVSGVKVLGLDVGAGETVDRVVTLIDTANLDPSDIPLPSIALGLTDAQVALINGVAGDVAKDALANAIQTARTAIDGALDGLGSIKVLDPTPARIKVAPGTQVKTATSVVQQALRVTVTIAEQTLVDAVLGEARTNATGVDCSKPIVDTATLVQDGAASGAQGIISIPGFAAPIDTSTSEGAALQCSTRRLVLVDVLERNGRVKLFGVADPALAGKRVSIVLDATDRVVATARVDRDGSFDTTAPLPPAAVRDTNEARYTATLGKEESINLKLRRRMVIDSMKSEGRRVTITGRVIRPLARPVGEITLTRRVSCTQEKVEKRFTPRPDGRFKVTVTAPRGLGAAVYRMTTRVRYSATGDGTFKTYTLPRAVDLTT